MTSSSTQYSDSRYRAPATVSVARRRTGTALIVVGSVVLIASALTKFLGVDAVVAQLEGFGFVGEVVPLGILEAATAVLFLVPRTRFAGLLMFSAFLGGAVATHIQHRMLPVPPAIVLTLGWAGVWLRYGSRGGDVVDGALQDTAVASPSAETPPTRFERVSVRAAQVVLALAALLFLAIGAKYVFDPEGAAAASGISLLTVFGITNMRAGLGGFSLGFGVVAAIAAPVARRTTMGLWFVVIVVGTVLLVRFVGAARDGSLVASRTVLIAETVLTALSVGALLLTYASRRRLHHQ